MNKKYSFTADIRPNLYCEAAKCICTALSKAPFTTIEDPESYGLTQKQADELVAPYNRFRTAITPEVMEIYKEFPQLHMYFTPDAASEENDYSALPMEFARRIDFAKPTVTKEDGLELLRNLLMELLEDFTPKSDYNALASMDLSHIILALSKAGCAPDEGMKIISLIAGRDRVFPELHQLLTRCATVLERHFEIIKPQFDRATKYIGSEEHDLRLLQNMPVEFGTNVHRFDLSISIFFPTSATLRIPADGASRVEIGLYRPTLTELQLDGGYAPASAMRDLKCLCDPVRMRIVRLLANREMYAGELSDMLGLTAATVSHHLSLMTSAHIITLGMREHDKKRVYYKINRDKINQIADSIRDLGKGELR